jgi:polar amino acid transport system substrate-binding protein
MNALMRWKKCYWGGARCYGALLLAMLSINAWAGCSRPIVVPAAPTGFNVQIEGDQVRGVFPEFLTQVGNAAGCTFKFPIFPRARSDLMFFKTFDADVLIPASQTSERDQKAQFVHWLNLTPSLITLKSQPDGVSDLAGLLGKTKWRAAVVRSYSWGDEYDELVRKLKNEQRIDFVADLATVGRLLRAGRVEFTILPPTLLYSALENNGRSNDADDEFRYIRLDGLPRAKVGAYLSRNALPPADLDLLKEGMHKASRDGSLMKILERYYPPSVIHADVVLNN